MLPVMHKKNIYHAFTFTLIVIYDTKYGLLARMSGIYNGKPELNECLYMYLKPTTVLMVNCM